jgi:CheY-like chemotaxis protein
MKEHEAEVASTSPPVRPRVLVVDDDPAIRLICTTWLTLDGYEVLEAANGQDALDLAFTREPAVVLLDLSIPVLDGFAVAKALRANERTRELPLVVLTGEAGPTVTQRVFEMGAAGFFTKPFDPGAVAAFVRSVAGDMVPHQGPAAAGGHAF